MLFDGEKFVAHGATDCASVVYGDFCPPVAHWTYHIGFLPRGIAGWWCIQFLKDFFEQFAVLFRVVTGGDGSPAHGNREDESSEAEEGIDDDGEELFHGVFPLRFGQ